MRYIIIMIKRTISYLLGGKDLGDTMPNSRAHVRLEGNNMVAYVNGVEFPVIDWSYGGVLIDTNNIPVIGDKVNLTLRLKHGDDIMTVRHVGSFLRKDSRGVVLQLRPINDKLKKQINLMVDAVLTDSFISSQAA